MGGSPAGPVGLKLWSPPPLIIPRVSWVGLLPPLLSLLTGALSGWLLVPLFRFVVVQAPCQKGKKMCFHPMCFYAIYSEFSGEFNNGQKWAFFQSSQNNYLIPDRVLVKDVQYPSWWNIARTTARSWVHFLGLGYTCHCAKVVELFPPFFHMAHHETNLQRQGYVANLVYKKCPPQNYKRGGGLGGSKVGWVGPKLGGWVLSKIPPPSYKQSLVWGRGTAVARAAVLVLPGSWPFHTPATPIQALAQKASIDMQLHIAAPTIVVPTDTQSERTPALCADLGRLTLTTDIDADRQNRLVHKGGKLNEDDYYDRLNIALDDVKVLVIRAICVCVNALAPVCTHLCVCVHACV